MDVFAQEGWDAAGGFLELVLWFTKVLFWEFSDFASSLVGWSNGFRNCGLLIPGWFINGFPIPGSPGIPGSRGSNGLSCLFWRIERINCWLNKGFGPGGNFIEDVGLVCAF